MSVNDIDVNAVNKLTIEKQRGAYCCENGHMNDDHECLKQSTEKDVLDSRIAGSTPETSDEEIAKLATYMRGSVRWKITYFKLRVIMVLESLIWTLMDIVRAWRMRTAARINNNYKISKENHEQGK